jgi:hypothetical protein
MTFNPDISLLVDSTLLLLSKSTDADEEDEAEADEENNLLTLFLLP